MCVATTAIGAIATVALTAAGTYAQNRATKKTNEYKQQIAINQAKSAQNEAQTQRQQGIEESRKERIKGIQNSSKLEAQNAASGFDSYSDTNLYNSEDIKTTYNTSADEILESYYNSAQKYDDKAKEYATQMKINDINTKNQINQNTMSALGTTTKVALGWYDGSNRKGGTNGNF